MVEERTTLFKEVGTEVEEEEEVVEDGEEL